MKKGIITIIVLFATIGLWAQTQPAQPTIVTEYTTKSGMVVQLLSNKTWREKTKPKPQNIETNINTSSTIVIAPNGTWKENNQTTPNTIKTISINDNTQIEILSNRTWKYVSKSRPSNETFFLNGKLFSLLGDGTWKEKVLKPTYGTLTDIDGNVYKTVKIGGQEWMAENLRTTRYADGTPIPFVQSATKFDALNENRESDDLSDYSKAYCWYNNDVNNKFGALYTWSATMNGTNTKTRKVSNTDWYGEEWYETLYNWEANTKIEGNNYVQGVCPTGWHIPSLEEWKVLVDYLGGVEIAGGFLKSTSDWNYPNEGASNLSGFNALPAGMRHYVEARFEDLGSATWFVSTANDSNGPISISLSSKHSKVNASGWYSWVGYSCRCIKDK